VRCARCKQAISRGVALQKAVGIYSKPDGGEVALGFDRPDGKPPWLGGEAPGPLKRCYHYKCFMIVWKAENRGGLSMSGAGVGHTPTAYEITALSANQDELALLGLTPEQAAAMSTEDLTRRVMDNRGDGGASSEAFWRSREKRRAEEKGGPYAHTHSVDLVDYQLKTHLPYAHGISPMASADSRNRQHAEAHARLALEATQAARAADPGYNEPVDSDWRDQTQLEVSDVPRADTPADLR
jgi:hypothetical protein